MCVLLSTLKMVAEDSSETSGTSQYPEYHILYFHQRENLSPIPPPWWFPCLTGRCTLQVSVLSLYEGYVTMQLTVLSSGK
jgi:hypothetical protein